MNNTVSVILGELEKDLTVELDQMHEKRAASGEEAILEVPEKKVVSGKEAILEVLGKAADDHKFLARLAENPSKVLQEYDLSAEEKAALASGDIKKIESWVGKLDKRLATWLWCRLQQEKW